MPGPRRPQTEAADALIAVAPLVSRWIERLLAAHQPPMTVAQYLALRSIAEDGVSGKELARRAGVSGPAVSQLLGALTDAGLLERRESFEDRRRVTLALSASGELALHSARHMLGERIATLLADLPRPEADALRRALPRVQAALSGAAPPKRPTPPHPKSPHPKSPAPRRPGH